MTDPGACNRSSRGVTLVELLVVIGIMLMLAAIAIPRLQPAGEERKLRETTRALSVFVGSARNRAMEINRPVGVMFERYDLDSEACIILRQAEVPPPFAGDTLDAVVRVQDWTIQPSGAGAGDYYSPLGSLVLKVAVREFDFPNGLLRRGDTIQFNHQGPWYTIIEDPLDTPDKDFPVDGRGYIQFFYGSSIGMDTDTTGPSPPGPGKDGWVDSHVLTVALAPGGLPGTPWPIVQATGGVPWVGVTPKDWPEVEARGIGYPGSPNAAMWSGAMPFHVRRQPVPSSGKPLQLPRGTAIDLSASGTDLILPQRFYPFPPAAPIVVMFSPTGAVDWVYYNDWSAFSAASPTAPYGQHRVTGPIHFLVGRMERMRTATTDFFPPAPIADGFIPEMDGWPNWLDSKNLWVTLNSQTGLVTVADNGFVDPPPQNSDATSPDYFLWEDPSTWGRRIAQVRQYAREAQVSKGGR